MGDATHNYLRFRVGPQWFGVAVEDVIEVLQFMMLTEPPGLPPGLLGILTLRDLVVPVVDLRLRFGLDDAPLTLTTPIIVTQTARGPLGMVVDDADDILHIEAVQISPAEESLSPFVAEVARCPGYLLLLLDPSTVSPQAQAACAELAEE